MPIFYTDNPLNVSSSAASPVNAVGLVGVTGAVAITSGVITAHADGLMGVTGTVAISSGVITSITNVVVMTATLANPAYVTSTNTNPVWITGTINAATTNPSTWATGAQFPNTGTLIVGVSGANYTARSIQIGTGTMGSGVLVTIASDQPPILVNGLVGVTGTVSITSGTLTGITNTVYVTSAFGSPVYVSSTLTNPLNSVGFHGVTGTVAISSGVITAQGLVGVTGAVAITSGVLTSVTTITNNVHTDGLMGVTGTVAISSGTITAAPMMAGIGGFTNPGVSGTASPVLAANTNRRGATIYNPTTATINIAYGFAATNTNYSLRLPQSTLIEVPFNFTGTINGFAQSAGPFALNVTEFTA